MDSAFGQTADTTLTHHPLVQLAVSAVRSDAAVLARSLGVGAMQDGSRFIPGEDPDTGALGGRVQPSVKRSHDGTDVQAIFDKRDEKHARGVIRKWLQVTGQEVPEEQFEAVFESLVKRTEEVNPHVQHTIELTPGHLSAETFGHGLLKIAYELTWLVVGDAWLDDAIAKTIRSCLADWPGDASKLVGNSSFLQLSPVSVTDTLPGDTATTHVGAVFGANGRILTCVRIFGLMSTQVVVSETGAQYANFAALQPAGQVFLQNAAVGGGYEQMTFAQAVRRKIREANRRDGSEADSQRHED